MLKYGGRCLVNIPTHHLLLRQMIWKEKILWEKNNYNCKYTAWMVARRSIGPERQMKRYNHPTMFPEERSNGP